MDAIERVVGSVMEHLSSAARSGAVAGEPIKLGEVTLVVLSMINLGMGAAGGQGGPPPAPGKASAQGRISGAGEGAGGAGKVRPVAVVAFTPEGVKVLPIPAPPGPFDKVVERVPEVVDLVERVRQKIGSSPAH